MKAELVSIDRLIPDPHNPRTDFNATRQAELAASIKTHGIKVPLIVYVAGEKFVIGDGHCRWEVARSLGLQEVPVIIFAQKPSEAELLTTQLTINGHRQNLNPVDEYEAFARLAKLKGWNASELAAGLAVSNAEITRVQSIGKLSAEERQLVREGKISKSSAYALTRMSPERRKAFALKSAAGEVTRDQLNEQTRKIKPAEEKKSQRISCHVMGGTVSIQTATGLNLAELIALLEELIRECRRARTQGLEISTAVRAMRDRFRNQPVT